MEQLVDPPNLLVLPMCRVVRVSAVWRFRNESAHLVLGHPLLLKPRVLAAAARGCSAVRLACVAAAGGLRWGYRAGHMN